MNNIHLHIIGSEVFISILNELSLNYNISFGKDPKHNKQDVLVRIIAVEKLQSAEIKIFFRE